MKIAIIGHPGSGKTYLANQLSARLGISIINLDELFDKHPYRIVAKKSYQKAFNSLLLDKNEFVINGYHGSKMPRWIWGELNMIIFLDLPVIELKDNIISRQKNAKQKKDFSHWQRFKLNNYKNFAQIRFRDQALRSSLKKILALSRSDAQFIVIKSRSEMQDLIDSFPRENEAVQR